MKNQQLSKSYLQKFSVILTDLISVMHDRTNIYKGSTFDYVLGQESSQKKVYDKVGIADLVKRVVDVS